MLFFWRTLHNTPLLCFPRNPPTQSRGERVKACLAGIQPGTLETLFCSDWSDSRLRWWLWVLKALLAISLKARGPGRHTEGRAPGKWTSLSLKLFLVSAYHPSPGVLFLSTSRGFQFLAKEIALLINISYGKVFFQTQGKEQDNFPWFRKVRVE